jgi:hypothetical protein
MRTQEERIRQLHIRAAELQRQAEKRKTAGWGGFCTCLFAMLLVCMVRMNDEFQNAVDIDLQGSSLLSESAGGYVLAAVLAFFAGVIITTVIYQRRRK